MNHYQVRVRTRRLHPDEDWEVTDVMAPSIATAAADGADKLGHGGKQFLWNWTSGEELRGFTSHHILEVKKVSKDGEG